MKRLNYLLIIIAVIFSINSISYSQPKISLHLTGGYGVPLGDFKVDVPTSTTVRLDADDFPYYTKQLINFGADGKLAIGKKGNFRVVLGFGYNMFSNNTNGTFRVDTTTEGTFVLGQTTFKPKVNVISINLGGEWGFMPKGKVNPFIGASIAGNFFGGKFEFGKSVFTKGAWRTELKMKSETRIGFIFDAGVDIMLSKQVGMIAGIKYHMINPLGKGADNEAEVAADEVDLGDKEHVRDDGTTSPNKSLSSFNGYLGVSFYFGAPKTMVKK
jgi:outer membrane protein W